jgi:hypothetical protein
MTVRALRYPNRLLTAEDHRCVVGEKEPKRDQDPKIVPLGVDFPNCAGAAKPQYSYGFLAGWRDRDSNPGHHDFQSCALPTELSRR